MQNLREIGSRYNGLQDALDAQKAALRGARDPQERRALRRSAAETRRELKRLKDPVKNAPGVKPTKLPGSMSVDWVKVWTRA